LIAEAAWPSTPSGANAADQNEGQMAAVVCLFSPRSSSDGTSTGTGGGMVSLLLAQRQEDRGGCRARDEEIPALPKRPRPIPPI